MKVKFDKEGRKLVCHVEGPVNTMTAPELLEQVEAKLSGVAELELDLKAVPLMSSAGFRTILTLYDEINDIGSMKLTGLNEVVYNALELTGMLSFLDVTRA